MKSQGVRLFDVFVLGPFMVWAGARSRDLPKPARAAMVIAGIGTVVYNGINYIVTAAEPEPVADPWPSDPTAPW